jgi:hypothetical protein
MEICRDRPLTNGGQPSADAEESFPPIKSFSANSPRQRRANLDQHASKPLKRI